MIIPLAIKKDNKEDCPYECPFRDNEDNKCRLFGESLKKTGYPDSYNIYACYECERFYTKALEENTQ